MSAADIKDVGDAMEVKVITIDNDALAAGTGDATEVTPSDDIDMDPYVSGYVEIAYVTTLTADKTLAFELQKEDSDTDGGSKSADAVVVASTVVATGAKIGYEGIYKIDITEEMLKGYKRFVNFLVTPDLSHSGTDTVTWSATWHGRLRTVS